MAAYDETEYLIALWGAIQIERMRKKVTSKSKREIRRK